MSELYEAIKKDFNLEAVNSHEMAPLMLAYIGDAVYEVIVRTMVISKGNRQSSKLHKDSTHLVNAATQAQFAESLMEHLTDEELTVYKRGRNANSHNKAKNASTGDYRKATGFEALIGFLFLEGKTDRIHELLNKVITNE